MADNSSENPSTDDSGIARPRPLLEPMPAPRVLLVDDDELLVERWRDLITSAGYEVSTAADGAAALASLQREFAPIVILDRSMPGMDGLALCREIRGATHYPSYVYIILFTARDSEDEVLTGLNAGADDYVSKRVSGMQLIARLATARRIVSLEHSLKQVIEERRHMALTDGLTETHNRRYFMTHMHRELKRCRRFGGDVALLMMDIDNFKRINDRYGHAAGDAVLVEFVRRVRASLPREYDWCARMGGEEFAVVLPQTPMSGAEVVAERIRRAVSAAPAGTPAGPVSFTVSIGVSNISAFADRATAQVDQLLSRADDCMYYSKKHGRDRVTVDGKTPGQDQQFKSVLYVDDDPDIREIVEMSLSLGGEIRVLTSDGGERALLKMRVEKPDLVVLDVMMPGMDGPTLLKRMRSTPELAHIPVIFMTAKANATDVERFRNLSAIGVIAKPFDPMTLGVQLKALWNAQ